MNAESTHSRRPATQATNALLGAGLLSLDAKEGVESAEAVFLAPPIAEIQKEISEDTDDVLNALRG